MATSPRWEKPGGTCPWCGGEKQVLSILEERMIPCRLCGAEGTWDGTVPHDVERRCLPPAVSLFDPTKAAGER